MRRYAAKDRAEILAEHLEEQFTLHPASDSHSIVRHHEEIEHRVREFLSAPIPSLLGDYYVSPTETRSIFRLPKRKAPGPDWTPTIAIKQLLRRAMVAMTRLFNGILRTGHFPACWKTGCVIAIPKAGKDPRLASSQRQITLLSHIVKLFERVLLPRLLRHLTPKQEQFGFRSDTLPRSSVRPSVAPGLLYKLIENWIPPASFLKRPCGLLRNSRGRDLGPASHQSRVPQGSCLSPCLYAVYTDDIPTLTNQLQHWEEDVVLALYADDSAYFASSRRADLAAAKIQRILDLLPEWLDKWRVAVNITKTAALLTGQQRTIPPKLRFRG
ncbi:RNA-directed DNA polymerase from mobile element jockey [Eumeta japonica]|uniref:RNA-directed DNA polymerase from mobile element jockey n=1 Tax=Eumeta variegata TaxID=151549 RepID=A0A4C1URB2_EUMVA|nr:RNA-directed DNA polymerase from mobile element jockey [Eumeta japonica]